MKKNYSNLRSCLLVSAGVFVGSLSNVFGQALVTYTYDYTGAPQTLVFPYCASQVTIEVWGAEGGGRAITGNTDSGLGGLGGYSKGLLNAVPGDVLNIYVGGYGLSSVSPAVALGGWNGGGSAYASSAAEPGNGGGGATDVRLNGNAFGNRIIVAGGGAGGGEDAGDLGGSGGGLSGTGNATYDASQTAPGTNGALGQGSSTGFADGGAGGGGYYGGGSGYSTATTTDSNGGGGGSGFIGGVISGVTIDGNSSMPNPNGGTMTGRSLNGFARISYITLGPVVGITTPTAAFCNGGSAPLDGGAVTTYTWLPVGTFAGSNSSSVTVNPTSTTIYTLEGTNTNNCISRSTLTITVYPLPTLQAIILPAVPCVGGTTTLIATGANSYTWSGSSSASTSTVINPTASGNYNYSGTNQFGCITNTFVAVNVNTNSLTISSNTTICSGETLTLTASGANTYTWSTGSNFGTTYVNPIASGVYTASGTDVNNCVLSNTMALTLNQSPIVTASASQNLICKGETVDLMAGNATTYTWSAGAGTGAKVTVTLPVDVTYYYTVTGTGANGCKGTATVSVISSRCSGLAKINGSNSNITIYPNPANGDITIELHNGLLNSIEVMDVTGRMVLSAETKEESMNMNLEKLSSGVYYFKIKSAENTEIIKVIKN